VIWTKPRPDFPESLTLADDLGEPGGLDPESLTLAGDLWGPEAG